MKGLAQGMGKLVQGTYAAVVTPRKQDGTIDAAALRSWLAFLVDAGIQGFAINGATGEFCLATEDELKLLVDTVADEIQGKAAFVAGIGASGTASAVRLGRIAAAAGASGLLLPMPYFFPYAQDDLASFCRSVAQQLDSQILLYNLPQFTSGLDPATSLELIRGSENIVGIKDSSGSLDTLRLLKKEAPEACRIIGNDGVLAATVRENLADAVVSGVACVLPELITSIFESNPDSEAGSNFRTLVSALEIFIQQLDKMPTPWGLKVMAEMRGLARSSFPFPLSERRQDQTREMAVWFAEHAQQLGVSNFAGV